MDGTVNVCLFIYKQNEPDSKRQILHIFCYMQIHDIHAHIDKHVYIYSYTHIHTDESGGRGLKEGVERAQRCTKTLTESRKWKMFSKKECGGMEEKGCQRGWHC